MDQFPFEFKMFVIGMEVDDFIEALNKAGFTHQAELCEHQFKKQMEEL
ncbi:hypothetical protein [Christiangramia crocea]|uniref:Uncharacterized protein n=1 Tax=Christiangramia crocea TaxID=2904124 RepID=A0A9X1UVF1_9FLAO|nr:hypothetical protein [Gramella crocea]MCG9970973.1 hypothetical protein [Gramella crocea]